MVVASTEKGRLILPFYPLSKAGTSNGWVFLHTKRNRRFAWLGIFLAILLFAFAFMQLAGVTQFPAFVGLLLFLALFTPLIYSLWSRIRRVPITLATDADFRFQFSVFTLEWILIFVAGFFSVSALMSQWSLPLSISDAQGMEERWLLGESLDWSLIWYRARQGLLLFLSLGFAAMMLLPSLQGSLLAIKQRRR